MSERAPKDEEHRSDLNDPAKATASNSTNGAEGHGSNDAVLNENDNPDFDSFTDELAIASSSSELREALEFIRNLDLAQRSVNVYITRNQAEHGIMVGDNANVGCLSGVFGDSSGTSRLRGTIQTAAFEVVNTQELSRVTRVFVQPRSYAEAQEILLEQHFLIIQGNPGCGKRATALHLASRIVSDGRISEIAPGFRFGDFSTLQFEGGPWCYLLDGIAAESFEDFDNYHLQQLLYRLKEHDAYIIATTQSIGDSQTVRLPEFCVTISPKDEEELVAIFTAHLEHYSSPEEDVTLASLALAGDDAVRSTLIHLQSLAQLDLFASRLVRVARNEISLERVVDDFALITDHSMDQWFLEFCSTAFERSFLISLAVFNGARTASVWQAARLLLELAPSLVSNGENEGVGAKTTIRDEARLYEKCRCEPGVALIQTEYGRVEVETLNLVSSRHQLDILSYVWRTYPRLRRSLTDWLYLIGLYGAVDKGTVNRAVQALQVGDRENVIREIEHLGSGQELRVLAAAAAGELSRYDFRTIQTEIFSPWIRAGKLIPQTLVGIALLVPLWDDRLKDIVLRLLRHWASIENPAFNSVAAIACGYVGTRYPAEALKTLPTIAQRSAPYLVQIVIQSVKLIFSSGYHDETVFVQVLQHLSEWSQEKDKHVQLIASLAFLEIAPFQAVVNETKMPVMLFLAEQSADTRLWVSMQLHRALQHQSVRRDTAATLKAWCTLSDKDPGRAATTDRIIRDMWAAGTQRDRQRLCALFAKWQAAQPPVEMVKRYMVACKGTNT